jgi:2-alkyl-3-oxoalkanoate reductase
VRVFVAGATGVIGRPLVAKLLEAGHEVTGMTRSEQSADGVRAVGAQAVVCDVYDRDALRAAVASAEPEAVIHQLTSLPARYDPRKPVSGETNRIRTEGTRNLVEAARTAGARRLLAQSIALMYAPEGGPVKDEDAPLMKPRGASPGDAMQAVADHEAQVLGADGMEGVVLRYGWFYGPGTWFGAGGSVESDVRRRRWPLIGDGSGGVFSFIHTEDAADATVAALEGATGVYNVADDDPAESREWVPVYAESVGAKPPRRVPLWLARLIAGKETVALAQGLRGASNEKARRELGWQPRWASWRQGFSEAPR